MISSHRRSILRQGAALMGASLLPVPAAFAQNASTFPNRPVKIIVAGAAGSAGDVSARLIGDALSTLWKQPVIIENQPGAMGSLATQAVARAEPDGHTLMMGTAGVVTTASALMNLSFKPEVELRAVHRVMRVPVVVVVGEKSPIRTTRDLVEMSKSKPGGLNYFSAPAQTDRPYFATVLFQRFSGAKWQYVGYKSVGDAMRDTATGDLDMAVVAFAPAAPLIEAGKLRVVALLENQRTPLAKDIPTLREAGFDMDFGESWAGAFAPAKTPASVVERIGADIETVLQKPQVRDRLLALKLEPVSSNPTEASQRTMQEFATWSKLIKELGLKL